MERMRNESLFMKQYPLKEMISSNRMILCNIKSWIAHIKHIISENTYAECCDIMCLTEIHVDDTIGYTPIGEFIDRWEDIHNPSPCGLAIGYIESTVKVNKEF